MSIFIIKLKANFCWVFLFSFFVFIVWLLVYSCLLLFCICFFVTYHFTSLFFFIIVANTVSQFSFTFYCPFLIIHSKYLHLSHAIIWLVRWKWIRGSNVIKGNYEIRFTHGEWNNGKMGSISTNTIKHFARCF